MATQTVIIGAGPAGLAAAAEIAQQGGKVTVLEQDPEYVGGISRTVRYKGFRFDIGGHRFFSKNPEISEWWRRRLPGDFIRVERQSRILYRKKLFEYPLRPGNALRNLGLATSAMCALSYLRRQIAPSRPERSFEDWVSNRFGDRLFNIFFKTYTEKVWGMPCSEISADWAAQRIKGLSLLSAVWSALRGTRRNGSVIKTLIDTFEYPRLGPGMMWEKTRDDITQAGGVIHMGRKVVEIHYRNALALWVRTRNSNGVSEDWPGHHFIISMPLRETVLSLRPRAAENVEAAALGLKYRDFVTVALIAQGENLFTDNWIYIHDPEVKVGRVQNFNNWSRAMVPQAGCTCLGLEYFCSVGDGMWKMSDDEFIETAEREAEQIGLIPAGAVMDACVVRMEKAYPVYDRDYEARVSTIRQDLRKLRNLQAVGRNGMHKYNNQDHSMMTGLLAARNVLGSDFDVWRVNTDAEYHEVGELPSGSRGVPKRIE